MKTVNIQIVADDGDIIVLVNGNVYNKYNFHQYESHMLFMEMIEDLIFDEVHDD